MDNNAKYPLRLRSACLRLACFVVLVVCCFFGQRSLLAEVFYDTFGPDPYTQSLHLADTWYNFSTFYNTASGWACASRFVLPTQSYRLDRITLDIGVWEEASPNLGLAIRDDDQGKPGDTVLDLMVPNPTGIRSSQREACTFSSSLHPVLTTNAPYWLVLEPARLDLPDDSANVHYIMSVSSVITPVTGRSFESVNGQWDPWLTPMNAESLVFRLEGVPVPEPGPAVLVGIGGLGLWAAIRRRSRGKAAPPRTLRRQRG